MLTGLRGASPSGAAWLARAPSPSRHSSYAAWSAHRVYTNHRVSVSPVGRRSSKPSNPATSARLFIRAVKRETISSPASAGISSALIFTTVMCSVCPLGHRSSGRPIWKSARAGHLIDGHKPSRAGARSPRYRWEHALLPHDCFEVAHAIAFRVATITAPIATSSTLRP